MNIYFVGMLISFAAYLAVGFFISKKVKTANDFYVAGRNAPTLLIVGSMVASFLSTGAFMGEAGEYYNGIFSPMIVLCTLELAGYLIGATYFGKYLRRSEVLSIPEFFGKRFASKPMRVLATVTALITMTVYLLSVMQGIATLMNVVTGVAYNTCIIISVLVFAAVSIMSGSRGVLITDTIMFSIFTIAMVVAVLVIFNKGGGWISIVSNLKSNSVTGLLSWAGNSDYLYPTGGENFVWALVYGVVWFSVCMVGPWQTSRYLMAKDEHTVVRSSVFSALGVFVVVLLIAVASVSMRAFDVQVESASHVLIWAAMNLLPTFLGVLLLTGVLAAGVSSATTFLSLIGTSVSNDIFKDNKNPIAFGRIAMLIVSAVVAILAITNPPQIFWIMYFGGAIIASAWMPIAFASILSKKVTKAGAFVGMLSGFVGCFVIKLYTNIAGITLPAILDPVVIGIVLNVIGMIIGSALTKVTEEEKKARAKLFVIPESEKDPEKMKKTLKFMKLSPLLGLVITLILILVWVIPYWNN